MDFFNLIWKLDATAVLDAFLHMAKIDCRKSALCVFTFAMLFSQFAILFWAHICSKETTASCFLYISVVQLSNSSLLLFCSETCVWFVSRWSFFSTVLIKLWYIWICTREKLTRLNERICLAVSCTYWEMTQYSLKAEMLDLDRQYGGKNVSFCNQLE